MDTPKSQPQWLESFRVTLIVLLSLYGLPHLVILPLEFVAVVYCIDVPVPWYLVLLAGALGLKYVILLALILSVAVPFTSRTLSIGIAVTCVVGLAFAGVFIYYTARFIEELNFGPFFDSPYFMDYLGFAICSFFGAAFTTAVACNAGSWSAVTVKSYINSNSTPAILYNFQLIASQD